MCRARQFVLLSGPRRTGKTLGALSCVVDHAWRTDKGNISVVSVSQSTGLDSGIWRSLTNNVIPMWIDAGMGMKWKREPYIANVSKRPSCSVTNAHGGVSEFQLDSLKFEHEVESRFKSREFTCMYVPELSNFREESTFKIWAQCLRAPHLTSDQFLFLADTNPSDDGEESWIYFLWFILPRLSYEEYCQFCHKKDLPAMSITTFESYKKSLGMLTFDIADNPYLSKVDIEMLEATYAGDQDLHDRYILGLWKKASSDALFAKVFRPKIHVKGEIETPANPDPQILVPESKTSADAGPERPDETAEDIGLPILITGWDPGSGVNSAFCIIEKIMREVALPSGKKVLKSIYKVLDEFIIVGMDHSLDEFTEECVKKMEYWEDKMGQSYQWRHWSDVSVFQMKEPRQMRYYHQIIHEASNGLVTLRGADRGPHSIRQRISLLRKLLFENRIYFSADKCPKIIEMLRSIKPGTSALMPIAKGSPMKHAFDCLMYAVASEAYEELDTVILNRFRSAQSEAGVVSVGT